MEHNLTVEWKIHEKDKKESNQCGVYLSIYLLRGRDRERLRTKNGGENVQTNTEYIFSSKFSAVSHFKPPTLTLYECCLKESGHNFKTDVKSVIFSFLLFSRLHIYGDSVAFHQCGIFIPPRTGCALGIMNSSVLVMLLVKCEQMASGMQVVPVQPGPAGWQGLGLGLAVEY